VKALAVLAATCLVLVGLALVLSWRYRWDDSDERAERLVEDWQRQHPRCLP